MLDTKEIQNILSNMFKEYGRDEHCTHPGGVLREYAEDMRLSLRRIHSRIKPFNEISIKGITEIIKEESCGADWISTVITQRILDKAK